MPCELGYAYYSGNRCNQSASAYDPQYCNSLSGYFTPHNEGYLEALTVNQIWSRGCNSQDKEGFCNSLVDQSGTPISNKPRVCGGTGPDIFQYNPAEEALNNAQEDMEALRLQYEQQDNSKKIIAIGIIVAVAIILIALIWN